MDVEECLAVTFADKWGVGQKIVALKASINSCLLYLNGEVIAHASANIPRYGCGVCIWERRPRA